MSDSFVNPIFGHREQVLADDPNQAEVASTGQPDVDAVVGSLDRLDDLPVADHVAVFEQAHETLRRTLAGARADLRQGSPAAGRG